MEETLTTLPFRRLRCDMYLIIEVLINVKYSHAFKFMFNLNKESRSFLQDNYIAFENGFVNDGYIKDAIFYNEITSFDYYVSLEKLYF